MERRNDSLITLGLGGMGVVLGGFGVLLFSGRGRSLIKAAVEKLVHAPEQFQAWNDSAQRELDRIQATLNHLAETLQEARVNLRQVR